ncbi:hypothetical protein NQ314_013984 [Rhamnusium bicolor]|uniref:Uncharacterized protein n=1 Tax=Rhamnusium bicolor TaxID=1586634 RepID=A0AAV8X4B0_9CUCU|nr:hypothetical protein NQ314_013984 [Rhamnusium bicolor]
MNYHCEKNMINHYHHSVHNIIMGTSKIEFNNYIKFEQWKTNMEKDTISKYIKYRTKDTNNTLIHYYRCYRDRFYRK